MKKLVLVVIGLLVLSACTPTKTNDDHHVVVRISLDQDKEPISDYMFGMFLEHLGNNDVGDLIDDGLWAEILDDRKFFYPVDNNEVQVPVNKRHQPKRWQPLGAETSVIMDSVHSYVGIHSPRIIVSSTSGNGIIQTGHALQAKDYQGRIVVSGDPGVEVRVRLAWADDEDSFSEYVIPNLTNEFRTYQFALTTKENTAAAEFTILGLGEGSFTIGAVSLMPKDNIYGFRPDVIALLKGLNSKIYRWGGNMSSGYSWRDGIGDPDSRPPRYDYAWNALENNDVGTDELLKFAELIGVEINLTVNAGLGGAENAAAWVEYTNGAVDTPMGRLRAENGHPEPYDLELWCIGNEAYGWWQLGHTDIKSYVVKHNQFAKAMKAVDPEIKIVASGATEEEMLITGNTLNYAGDVYTEFIPSSDWSGSLLANAQDNIDYMSEHFYSSVDQRFDLAENNYVSVEEPLEDWTRRPANRVRAKAERYREIYKEIPGSSLKKVYMDEWAYFTNWVHPTPTLGVSMGYARALHEMFRNTDIYKMSGHTFGTSCLSFNDTAAVYNTTGLMFSLYESKLGRIPVKIVGNSPQPGPKWPIGAGQTAKNAGGDAYPLDIFGALSKDQTVLTIAIVNPTEENQLLSLELPEQAQGKTITKWVLNGKSSARNIVTQQPEARIEQSSEEYLSELLVPAASISIYHYSLKKT